MAFYLSPLVDVNEVDVSTTIPAVATSIGAIIVRNTYKGSELKQTFVSNKDELVIAFGDPTTNSDCYRDMLSAEAFLKYGNKLYATRVMPASATFAGGSINNDSWTGTPEVSSAYKLSDLTSEDPDQFHTEGLTGADMYFIANSRGAWGNNVRISLLDRTSQTSILTGGVAYESFNTSSAWLSVDDRLEEDTDFLLMVQYKDQGKTNYVTKEIWNVSTLELAIDDQGASKFVENVINENSKYIRMKLDPSMIGVSLSASTLSNFMTFSSGADNQGDLVSNADIMDALDLYRNSEETDINILIDSDKPEDVKRYMIVIAEERKDCIVVLDCQESDVINQRGSETTNLRDWRRGLASGETLNANTSYAALYGNWFEVYNRYTKKYVWVPASGYVAGIYAKTDDVSGPWFAPAGLNRGVITGIRKLAWNPSQGARDILYSNGINSIVSFAGQGKVTWGQKTMLDKSSAFNRVNVRRLFMVMEKAISTATKYFLFEPNDPATRRVLVNMIEPFLRDVKARRGVYDFKVVCDNTINTPERVDRNELWCNIFIKPTRSAEFIILNFIATKTGASFDELTDIV
jgi:hypothetical protein